MARKKAVLSREQLLGAPLKTEQVDLSKYGLDGVVIVQEMTGADRDAFEQSMFENQNGTLKQRKTDLAMVRFVAYSLVDENGTKLFSQEKEDITALAAVGSRALQYLFDVAQRLSGFTREHFNELEKNSEAGQNGDSGIG